MVKDAMKSIYTDVGLTWLYSL